MKLDIGDRTAFHTRFGFARRRGQPKGLVVIIGSLRELCTEVELKVAPGICLHYTVFEDGEVYRFHPDDTCVWVPRMIRQHHVPASGTRWNSDHLVIASEVTEEAKASLGLLVADLRKRYGIGEAGVVNHILREPMGPPPPASPPEPDPVLSILDLKVGELRSTLEDGGYDGVLDDLLVAEREGRKRKGAIEAIVTRKGVVESGDREDPGI